MTVSTGMVAAEAMLTMAQTRLARAGEAEMEEWAVRAAMGLPASGGWAEQAQIAVSRHTEMDQMGAPAEPVAAGSVGSVAGAAAAEMAGGMERVAGTPLEAGVAGMESVDRVDRVVEGAMVSFPVLGGLVDLTEWAMLEVMVNHRLPVMAIRMGMTMETVIMGAEWTVALD